VCTGKEIRKRSASGNKEKQHKEEESQRKKKDSVTRKWLDHEDHRTGGCKVDKPNPLRVRVLGLCCKGFYPLLVV
jgi:hypothetical protein